MSKLAFAGGVVIFWSPVIGALIGGRVANALVLLTPLALLATIVWSRTCKVFLPSGGHGQLSRGVKVTAWITVAMMVAWAGVAVATQGLNTTALLVT